MHDFSLRCRPEDSALAQFGLLLLSSVLLCGVVLAATLSENQLASKTAGPGTDDFVALNFSYTGDRVLNGTSLSYGSALSFGQDADWSMASYEKDDDSWDAGQDFLAVDHDSDGAYTSRNDTIVNGSVSGLSSGASLVEQPPWSKFAFFDGQGNGWSPENDTIIRDYDNDTLFTAGSDFNLSGTLSEGDELLDSRPGDWQRISFYNSSQGISWQPANDSIVLENSTSGDFHGIYNSLEDRVLAGNSSLANGSQLYDTRPEDWVDVKFRNGSSPGWSASDDGIANDTAGKGTYSTRNDSIVNGRRLSGNEVLDATNPFTGDPGLAFRDSGDGSWNVNDDLIIEDYGNLTLSKNNDTRVAGTPPQESAGYSYSDSFHPNWTLTSYDSSDTGGFNLSEDAVVLDDDNNSVFGHELNSLTVENASTAGKDDIDALRLWAENTGDTSFTTGDSLLDNATYSDGHWAFEDMTYTFTSGQDFYVTANISAGAIGMPELQLRVPALNDVDGNGTYNDTADRGLFVSGTSDTGGLTGTASQTVYTPNITEVRTESDASWGAKDKNVDKVIVKFSERVDVGTISSSDLNLTNPDFSGALPNDKNNVSQIAIPLVTSPGGGKVTGIKYYGGGRILTNQSGYELSTDNSTVEVIDGVNSAPTADSGGDRTVDEGSTVQLSGSGSTDPDPDDDSGSLSYEWEIINDETGGASLDGGSTATGQSVSLTVPEVDSNSLVDLNLVVNDSELTDSEAFTVTVTNSQASTGTGGGGSGSGSGGNNQQSSGGNGEQQQQEPEAINRSVIVGRGNSETLDIGAETVGKLKVSAVDDHDLIGSIEYREFDSRPSSVESPPRGQTYRWLEVERNKIDNRNVRSAVFHFKVSKGWLSDNSIAPETVKLLRYNEGWLELDTSVRSEDAGNVYYRATSPGFSYFTITGRTYQSLFEVRQLSVDRKRLMAGGNVSINVTVYNGAQESASYTVEVDAGGKTLSREVTVEGRSNRTVSFLRTFESGGTKKISAGGRSVEVVVETEGLPWMMIGGGLLGIIGLFAVYVFWPRITGEIHTLEMSVEGVIEDLEKTAVGLASKAGVLHEVVRGVGGSGRDYSFEGFGDDEDFDYSFDKA